MGASSKSKSRRSAASGGGEGSSHQSSSHFSRTSKSKKERLLGGDKHEKYGREKHRNLATSGKSSRREKHREKSSAAASTNSSSPHEKEVNDGSSKGGSAVHGAHSTLSPVHRITVDPVALTRGMTARLVGACVSHVLPLLSQDDIEKDLALMNAHGTACTAYAQKYFAYRNPELCRVVPDPHHAQTSAGGSCQGGGAGNCAPSAPPGSGHLVYVGMTGGVSGGPLQPQVADPSVHAHMMSTSGVHPHPGAGLGGRSHLPLPPGHPKGGGAGTHWIDGTKMGPQFSPGRGPPGSGPPPSGSAHPHIHHGSHHPPHPPTHPPPPHTPGGGPHHASAPAQFISMPVRIDPEEEKRIAQLRRTIACRESDREELEGHYVSLRAHYVRECQLLEAAKAENELGLGFLQDLCEARARVLALRRVRCQMVRDVHACLRFRRDMPDSKETDKGSSGPMLQDGEKADSTDEDGDVTMQTVDEGKEGKAANPALQDILKAWEEIESSLRDAEMACQRLDVQPACLRKALTTFSIRNSVPRSIDEISKKQAKGAGTDVAPSSDSNKSSGGTTSSSKAQQQQQTEKRKYRRRGVSVTSQEEATAGSEDNGETGNGRSKVEDAASAGESSTGSGKNNRSSGGDKTSSLLTVDENAPIPWNSSAMPRTPYGVPLYISQLCHYPDRVLGAGYGTFAGTSPTAMSYTTPCGADSSTRNNDALPGSFQSMKEEKAELDALEQEARELEELMKQERMMNEELQQEAAVRKKRSDEMCTAMALLRSETEGVLLRHNVILDTEEARSRAAAAATAAAAAAAASSASKEVDDAEHEADHDVEHDAEHDVEHDAEDDAEHDAGHDAEHDAGDDAEHDTEHDAERDTEHDLEREAESEEEEVEDESLVEDGEQGARVAAENDDEDDEDDDEGLTEVADEDIDDTSRPYEAEEEGDEEEEEEDEVEEEEDVEVSALSIQNDSSRRRIRLRTRAPVSSTKESDSGDVESESEEEEGLITEGADGDEEATIPEEGEETQPGGSGSSDEEGEIREDNEEDASGAAQVSEFRKNDSWGNTVEDNDDEDKEEGEVLEDGEEPSETASQVSSGAAVADGKDEQDSSAAMPGIIRKRPEEDVRTTEDAIQKRRRMKV